jgi:hypothetical protein
MFLRGSGGVLFASALALGACSSQSPTEDDAEVSTDGLSGVTPLTALSSGKCVDVAGSSTADGAQIQQSSCTSGSSQRFTIKDMGSSQYELVNVNSGKCLDVTGVSKSNGAVLQQWTCGGSANQLWKLVSKGTGTYQVQSVNSSKCLDVTGVSSANGALIQQWTCGTGTNQLFKMSTSTSGGGSGGASGSGGSGGMSTGGATGAGGSSAGGSSAGGSGLGGSTNSYGTIVGSPAVQKLLALTANCTAANKIASDTNKFATDSGKTVHVCALPGVAGTADSGGAIFWSADMDIDCDGVTTTNCPGTGADKDPTYYYQTSFAGPHSAQSKDGPALSAEKTPYVVIPDEITNVDQQNGGNIVAVIYNGQIEFAVFGDQIEYQKGDASEPIGEASVRTAKGLGIPASPASGGVSGGVTYIAFTGKGTQPKDMEDVAEIQALGTKLLESLLQNAQ